MKISNKARNYIKANILDDSYNVLELNIASSCCSGAEHIHLGARHDEYTEIVNEIKVYYDTFYQSYVDKLLIDYDGGIIFFLEGD